MKARRSLKVMCRSAVVSVVTVASIAVAGVQPAHAVTWDQVVTGLKVAYEVYDKFLSGRLTLDQATAQIIQEINKAKREIISEIDAMATVGVRGCAKAAVIDAADVARMSRDTLQAFARDATLCVSTAEDSVLHASDKAVIDEVGFALNSVGPVALMARARARFSTDGVTAVLVNGNQGLISRLDPSCRANPLWGDAEPGAPVEVHLTCRAFNGNVGHDFVWANIRRGQPLPNFNYSQARAQAMRGTSHQIARSVLPVLTAM